MRINWDKSVAAFDYFPSLKNAMIWENSALSLIIFYGIWVGFMIWRGSVDGRKLALSYISVRFFGIIILEAVAAFIIRELPKELFIASLSGIVPLLMREAILCGIWWSYFKKSKRVKNTYTSDILN